MAKRPAEKSPALTKIVVEYENLELKPVYVEGAQGMGTTQGALHVSFYSEYTKSKAELKGKTRSSELAANNAARVQVSFPDPFLSGDEIRIVRTVESALILTAPVLRSLIPWLQLKLQELESNTGSGISSTGKEQ